MMIVAPSVDLVIAACPFAAATVALTFSSAWWAVLMLFAAVPASAAAAVVATVTLVAVAVPLTSSTETKRGTIHALPGL